MICKTCPVCVINWPNNLHAFYVDLHANVYNAFTHVNFHLTPNQGADRNAPKWHLLARPSNSILMHSNKRKDSSHNYSVKKDVVMGLYTLTFTFMLSSLPCLHTFWHAIPTSCYIFNVLFYSCNILVLTTLEFG